MVMVMFIDREHFGDMLSEQRDELRVAGHQAGMAGAAHVMIEAHHGVGSRHDHVEIMRHEKDAASVSIPHIRDEPV